MTERERHPVRGAARDAGRAVVGCILAGGGSTRMGRPDKGLETVGGLAMIARAAQLLGRETDAVLLSANGDPARFAGLGLEVVADAGGPDPGRGDGPLAGVLAALEHAPRVVPGVRYVATVPSDAPFLPSGLVGALLDAADGDAVVIATSGGVRHPTVALWPVGLAAPLRQALARGVRKIGAFAAERSVRLVAFPPLRAGAATVDPFFNVNTGADLEEARRLEAQMTGSPRDGHARLSDDCFAPGEGVLSHDAAVALIRERATTVAGVEEVPLAEALGRILAESVSAGVDVPLTDTSAVDGYAFRAADHADTGGFMPVVARILAGDGTPRELAPWAAARIFTGAVMPAGADTVAMQEDCETHEQDGADYVIVPSGLAAGANRRLAGEDVAAGSEVMAPGLRLRPQDVGALASVGRDRVRVRRRLRVGLASTGDEVVRPGRPLTPGRLYDSNHALLSALLAAAGAEVADLGVLPDDAGAVRARLAEAAAAQDLVVTSGGVSAGDADHVADALGAIGRRHLWKIAVKPGRPLAFGQVGDCAVLGLPGNPVVAFACFLLYGLPLVAGLSGERHATPRRYRLPAAFSIPSRRTGRREFLRGTLVETEDGLGVARFARDGSNLITGLRAADGFVDLAEDREAVAEGDPVDFLPFSGFGPGLG